MPPAPQIPPPPSADILPFSARLHPKVLSSRSFPQGASRSHIHGGLSLLLLAVFSVYGPCMLFCFPETQEDLGLLHLSCSPMVGPECQVHPTHVWQSDRKHESARKPRFCDAPRPSSCQPHYVRLILSIPLPLSQLGTGFHSTRASFPTADLPKQCCDGENHTSEGALLRSVSPPASLFASTGSSLSICCSIHSIQAPGGHRGCRVKTSRSAFKAPPQSSNEAADKPPSFSQRLLLFNSNFKTITIPTREL